VRNTAKVESRAHSSNFLFKKLDLLNVTALFLNCFVYVSFFYSFIFLVNLMITFSHASFVHHYRPITRNSTLAFILPCVSYLCKTNVCITKVRQHGITCHLTML